MSFPAFTRIAVVLSFTSLFALSGSLASDFQSARTTGLGGAGHAAPILTDAIYMNPAMISFLNAYSFTVSRDAYHGPDGTEPKGNMLNASVQDGTDPALAGGLGYTSKAYGKEVSVGASTRLGNQFGLGVGGKFLFGSDSKPSAQDAVVSALVSPLPWLQTSVIVDNALQTSKTKQWGLTREFILGVKVNIEKIMLIYVDPHVVPAKPSGDTALGYEAGIELPIFADFYIRGGLNKNTFQPQLGAYGHGHAFGVGWSFPRLSLDAAIGRTIEPVRTNNFIFSVTII